MVLLSSNKWAVFGRRKHTLKLKVIRLLRKHLRDLELCLKHIGSQPSVALELGLSWASIHCMDVICFRSLVFADIS